jgi:hypothetical protein
MLVKNGDTLAALLQANNYLDPSGDYGQAATKTGSLNDGSGLVGTGFEQSDDVGLIWLRDPSQTTSAVATLQANLGCTKTGICADGAQASILSGAALAAKFGDPAQGRTPDIIVQPNPAVIYTSSKSKDADHGGNAPDDSHLGLLVAYPGLKSATNATTVSTTQVAPTILKSLNVNPGLLQSVAAEGTQVLPGLGF